MPSSKKLYLVKWSIVLLFITYLTLLIVYKSKFDELGDDKWISTVGTHVLNLIILIIGLAYVHDIINGRGQNWHYSGYDYDYKRDLLFCIMFFPMTDVCCSFMVIVFMTKQKINILTTISCIPAIICLIVIFSSLIFFILMVLYSLLNFIYDALILDCCYFFRQKLDNSNNQIYSTVEILLQKDPNCIESVHEKSSFLNNNNSNKNYSAIII